MSSALVRPARRGILPGLNTKETTRLLGMVQWNLNMRTILKGLALVLSLVFLFTEIRYYSRPIPDGPDDIKSWRKDIRYEDWHDLGQSRISSYELDTIKETSDYELAVISLASTTRLHYAKAQNESWGSQLGENSTIAFYDEIRTESLGHCVVCDSTKYKTEELVPDSVFVSESRLVWTHKNEGWWCAQKRLLLAFKHAIQTIKAKWYMVIDDDTLIVPWNLHALLTTLDPSRLVYLGDRINPIHLRFVGGGGGHLLSRALVNTLLEPVPDSAGVGTLKIDECIAKTQGGDWCFMHSDWSLAECVYQNTGMLPEHQMRFQQNIDGVGRCEADMITSHYMNDTSMYTCIRNLIE
eukprot:CFRG4860T1